MSRSRGAGRSFQSEPVRVSVVIPTYNEAQSIGLVLADIPAGIVQQVLVVDSASTDGTSQIARDMGAEVQREPRRGYGRACLTGLAAVNAPDVVVFLDGDYSDRPAEMSRLLEPLREGAADRFSRRSPPHGSRSVPSSTLSSADCARATGIHIWMAGRDDREGRAAGN